MSYVRVLGNKISLDQMVFEDVQSQQISKACLMTTRFVVNTPEGTTKGEAGDYLMQGSDAHDLYIVKASRFGKLYKVAAEPKPMRDKVAEMYGSEAPAGEDNMGDPDDMEKDGTEEPVEHINDGGDNE